MSLTVYCILALTAGMDLAAQAPNAASLWDIPATTLARPAALEDGATGSFWNPAAALAPGGLRMGAQAIQTPEALGLSAILAGMTYPLGKRLSVGLVFGRVQIGDLVRTSPTSPESQPGDIPVYEQTGGIAIAARFGPVSVGGLVRGHDAQLDVFREAGLSADLGFRIAPLPRLTIAGASLFGPVRRPESQAANYYGGVEYRAFEGSIWGAPAALTARYGAQFRPGGVIEHTVGAGIQLASNLRIDGSGVRENAYGDSAWRLILGLGVRAGPYDIIAALGSGLRGIGGNFRVGLEVDLD